MYSSQNGKVNGVFSAFYGSGCTVLDSSERTKVVYLEDEAKVVNNLVLPKKEAKAVKKHCALCGIAATHKCPCGTYYCGKKCQRNDWASHKQTPTHKRNT